MDEKVLYIAYGGDNKPAFERIVDLCPPNDYSSVLYLSPDPFILKEAGREFFWFLKDTGRGGAFIPFRSLTLKGLASGLMRTSLRGRLISEDMRILILSEITGQKGTGYAAQLSDLLRRIRHYLPHTTLSEFRERAGGLIFEEKAFRALDNAIKVLEQYEEEIKRRGLVDVETPLEAFQDLQDLPSYDAVVIRGFYDPTPLELSALSLIIERSKRLYIFAERDTGLLDFLLSTQTGFSVKESPYRTERDRPPCHRYRTMEDEVEGMARRVKGLIHQGIRPWRIVITFPQLSKYLPMLKRVFRRFEIPLDAGRYDITHASPLVALEDILSSIEGDYPRTDFLSFLSSPYFPRIPDILKRMAVPYSYKAKVIKGRDSWLNIGRGLISTSDDEMDDEDRERLKRFDREMASMMESLEMLRGCRGLLPFIELFESTLERLGFFDVLKGLDVDMGPAITERFTLLRRFAMLYEVSKHEPWFYLREFLRGMEYYPEGFTGVRALPYELAGSVEADAIFFGGLTEEDFPSRPAVDPYLPDSVKRALGMPDLEYYIDRQKRYFKRLLDSSPGRLYLSYPSGEEDKPHLPSPLLDWEAITEPGAIDIFSTEDVLVAEGHLMGIDGDSAIIWTDDIPESALLRRRIDRLTGGAISVTDIDSFRRCPMRFYIEKVLGLQMLESPRYEVEGRIWGSLAHRVMENLYRARDFDLDELEPRIMKAIEEAIKGLPVGGFWAKVATEIFRRRLPLIKMEEAALRREGFVPYKIEERITAEVDGVRLKGKIDRVDRRVGSVMLIDYKTGTTDNRSLQLPLYAYMWQKVHGDVVEKTGFYSLRDIKIDFFPKRVSMEEFVHEALERLRGLVNMMRHGDFPPEPERAGECRFCYNSALCAGAG